MNGIMSLFTDKTLLITGGTVFVSKFVANYYVKKGDAVYVLNRNHRPQVEGVTLIEADRHDLKDALRAYDFDVVIDVAAYTAEDIHDLLNGLGNFKEYIFIKVKYFSIFYGSFRRFRDCIGTFFENTIEKSPYFV